MKKQKEEAERFSQMQQQARDLKKRYAPHCECAACAVRAREDVLAVVAAEQRHDTPPRAAAFCFNYSRSSGR